MALTPVDEIHALQIQAGTLGRRSGHEFEDTLTKAITNTPYPVQVRDGSGKHVFVGDPAASFLQYVGRDQKLKKITGAIALSTGALATSEQGKQWLSINGANVSRCKSDIVVTVSSNDKPNFTVGISVKQCNNPIPTNAQLYFTTARGFATLLRNNRIAVSEKAVMALRQFCGDQNFRPCDNPRIKKRRIDPRRYFWEEIDADGRSEWERILSKNQDRISRLLFQKAYMEDPFVPDYLLHKTKRADSWSTTEAAIYSIEELIALSRKYGRFNTKSYSVKKGSYKDPRGVTHLAPRFGVIQMQRGGQKQHPEQLQFNLEAGYFYKI